MFILLVFTDPTKVWKTKRLNRLVKSTPLLDGYELHELDLETMKAVHRQRRVCSIAGHLWEVDSIVSTGDPDDQMLIYDLVCWRCFPHIHSRRAIQSYNLFAIAEEDAEKDQD